MLSRREINSIKSLIEKGNVRKIIEKLDTGLDPNTQIEWYSLLGFAARQQQLGIVALLLDHGADPNQSIIYDQRRHTVLKWSIAPSNNEQVIELLLQRGMDPNMPDMYNFPPIYFVVM